MGLLWLGLLLFIVPHSLRLFAADWREARMAAMGERAWKALVALVSLAGLVLIVYGFAQARAAGTALLWVPGPALRHLASPLTLVAFILGAAAYTSRSRLRAVVGHPLTLGVALWAAGHLVANGSAADVVLFGVLLLWAVIEFIALRARDRRTGQVRAGIWGNDLFSVVIGTVAWYVFAIYLHGPLIGVQPFG